MREWVELCGSISRGLHVLACVCLCAHAYMHARTNINDFPHEKGIDVCRQVQLLIRQATSPENFCQCYIGW